MNKTKHPAIKRIAFIENYLPRQCGIATFTTADRNCGGMVDDLSRG